MVMDYRHTFGKNSWPIIEKSSKISEFSANLSFNFLFYRVPHTTLYISEGNSRKIDHVYVHPSYNPLTYDHNIAVLEVDTLIPTDDVWVRPVHLPKTPATLSNRKLSIAFPVGATLNSYMADIMSEDACAHINGNTNILTNTLICINGLCTDHECDAFVS